MISFPDWFKELCANYVWYEPAIQHHEPETFKGAANKVYMQYVASEIFPPVQEARKHVYNVLCKIPPDKKVGKNWHVKALDKIEEKEKAEWIPLTGEERAKKLAEFKAMIDNMPIANYRPPAKEVFYGKPVEKLPPYPVTPASVIYEKDRHIEYLRHSYHPLTREKLPGWLPESEFNRLYDEGLI